MVVGADMPFVLHIQVFIASQDSEAVHKMSEQLCVTGPAIKAFDVQTCHR
jgi:hypothetical protein